MSRRQMFLGVILFGCLLALYPVAAQAQGIPLAGAEVSWTAFNPIGGGDSIFLPTLTLMPYPKAVGPDSPGKWDEVVPWLKSSVAIEIPFEGDETTLVRARGLGVSLAVTFGELGGVPVRGGAAWLTGAGTCVFVRAALLEIK